MKRLVDRENDLWEENEDGTFHLLVNSKVIVSLDTLKNAYGPLRPYEENKNPNQN